MILLIGFVVFVADNWARGMSSRKSISMILDGMSGTSSMGAQTSSSSSSTVEERHICNDEHNHVTHSSNQFYYYANWIKIILTNELSVSAVKSHAALPIHSASSIACEHIYNSCQTL